MGYLEDILNNNLKLRFSIETLGCKVNRAESNMLENILKNQGNIMVDLSEKPEVCIINTCTVTCKSDYQSRQLIRRASRSGAKVIVTGCFSEKNEGYVKKMEGVVDILKNDKKTLIINELIYLSKSQLLNNCKNTRFFFKIQDGCNSSCTYCVIPKVRGSSRSLDRGRVIEEIRKAHEAGHKEVVLTGIHLGHYGADLMPPVKLDRLITGILKETDIERIRLSSIEINEIREGLLEVLADRRLCKHLHIPLQSGDDRILGLMKRPYNRAYFIEKIHDILRKFPDIGLGTDVIAGFPGEGDEEFKNTYNLIKEVPFSYLHVFPYSKRLDTEASEMTGIVGSSIVKERCSMLRALGEAKKRVYMDRFIGKTLTILIEDRVSEDTYAGTSSNYLKIRATSFNDIRGSLVNIRVAGHDGKLLYGRPCNDCATN